MPVGLFPRESADILAAQPDQGTSAPIEPGLLEGVGPTAIAKGIAEGGAKALEAGETAVASGVQSLLSPLYEAQFRYGNLGGAVPPTGMPVAEDPEVTARRVESNAREAVKQYQLDPHTNGLAAQTLHGLASGVGRFTAGTLLTGSPYGGAATVGATEGVDTANTLKDQGVDAATADSLGAANALFAGGSSLLPGGYGKTLTQRILTGAAANTYSGFAQRGMTHNVLEAAGYTAQAQQYRALDASAAMADAVLGAGFGATHHLFSPSAIDAAHTVADADHIETSTPGSAIPATPAARDAHVANMTAMAEAMLRGDDQAPALRDVEMVPNPGAARAGEARTAAVEEAAREANGEPVGAPAQPTVERRADAIELARLQELRAKRNANDLTDAEKDELLTLQERDRLAARIGGRRVPGVQNLDAYAEMLARGEAKPTQGFVDMDMLKALNDTYGHSTGDEAIRTLLSTLSHYFGEGNVFHRSGDEIIVQSDSEAAHQSAMEAARQHLSNYTLESTDTTGTVRTIKGIGFSHGSGKTVELAEQGAYADKQLRKRQGLRSDRPADDGGPVAAGAPASDRQVAGNQTARTKASGKVSAAKATSELSNALRDLAADPANQSAHTAVRAALKSIEDSGLDAGSIERAAVERGGQGAGRVLEGAKATEHAAIRSESLDPETREAVDQAQAILERRGDQPIAVTDESSGAPLPAREALTKAVDELKNAQSDGELTRVAAACFGRG